MARILHVLNGDATRVTLERSGVPGRFTVWADVLHDGPCLLVPPDGWRRLRRRYLASQGFLSEDQILAQYESWDRQLESYPGYDEVVFWLEHDLFDQLLLIHHLHWLASRDRGSTTFSLICIGEFPGVADFMGLGQLAPEQLVASLLETRRPISEDQLAVGAHAWERFCAPDPSGLVALLSAETTPLPFLAGALRRFLEDYPAAGMGALPQRSPDPPRDRLRRVHRVGGVSRLAADGGARVHGRLVLVDGRARARVGARAARRHRRRNRRRVSIARPAPDDGHGPPRPRWRCRSHRDQRHRPLDGRSAPHGRPLALDGTHDRACPCVSSGTDRAAWTGTKATAVRDAAIHNIRGTTMTDDRRCVEFERFQRIDAAFRAGDLAALRAAVEDPASIPNGSMPPTIGSCLEYAIYHSPVPFVRELLELGADPNPGDHAGFPPLMAALSCGRAGGAGRVRDRDEIVAILQLLLAHGADPNGRGINDWAPLHMAVAERNRAAVEVLLEAGADPDLPTRIDECESPKQMAEGIGLPEIAALLAARPSRPR